MGKKQVPIHILCENQLIDGPTIQFLERLHFLASLMIRSADVLNVVLNDYSTTTYYASSLRLLKAVLQDILVY